jgi:hypothetical protein
MRELFLQKQSTRNVYEYTTYQSFPNKTVNVVIRPRSVVQDKNSVKRLILLCLIFTWLFKYITKTIMALCRKILVCQVKNIMPVKSVRDLNRHVYK